MSWTEDIDLVDRLADVLLRRRGYTLDARPGADFLARADGEQIDEARDDARAVLVAVGPHIAAQGWDEASEWVADPHVARGLRQANPYRQEAGR